MPTAIVLFASLVMRLRPLPGRRRRRTLTSARRPTVCACGVQDCARVARRHAAVARRPGAGASLRRLPRRRPGFAAIETVGVNVLFNLMNRALRPAEERDQFKVGFSSWWDNLKYGFEWDDNSFQVNQIGHPYQAGSTSMRPDPTA